jgi:hypothetical protein
MSGETEIGPSVIGSVSVNVINLQGRPFSGHKKPNNTVSHELFILALPVINAEFYTVIPHVPHGGSDGNPPGLTARVNPGGNNPGAPIISVAAMEEFKISHSDYLPQVPQKWND